MLKMLGSTQPVKAEGFKAAVDAIHNTMKGDAIVNKSIKSLFRPGNVAVTLSKIPTEVDRARIAKLVAQNSNDTMNNAGDSDLGHYMPEHQTARAATQVRTIQYLQGLKPQPQLLGPMDKPVPPSQAAQARYNRALDIAASPTIVLQHIQDGTLLPTDIQDLHQMYPALYQNMAGKITKEMASAQEKGLSVPYKTRVSMSMFLGQPLDSSMQPSSIQAAQPQPKGPPPNQAQGQQGKAVKGSPKALKKVSNDYQTPGQNAEKDRSARD